MPLALIIDQQESRSDRDRIPDAVATLNRVATDHLLMPFQRTIGDECQGVLASFTCVPDLVSHLAVEGRWWIGIGIGDVDGVAPDSRDVSGSAFGRARDMVERAKKRTRRDGGDWRQPWPLRVEGAGRDTDQALEACLAVIFMIVNERTDREHQIVSLVQQGWDQREIAAHLEISQPAITKAIARSHWDQQHALMQCARFVGKDLT